MKKILANIVSDYLLAILIGLFGLLLIALGAAFWPPLIIAGGVFIIIALFLGSIWP
jgi:hypothetical protein